MGKLRYPRQQLLVFRGTISSIAATLRGAQNELKGVGLSQTAISELERLEQEVRELFKNADDVMDQQLNDEVYEDIYISTALKMHLIVQQSLSVVTPLIASLDDLEQTCFKRASLLPEMQTIIAAHLRNIISELDSSDAA